MPKKAQYLPKMTAEVKRAIPYIVLHDLAAKFRAVYPEYRVEAHPDSTQSAHLVLADKNKNRVKFSLFRSHKKPRSNQLGTDVYIFYMIYSLRIKGNTVSKSHIRQHSNYGTTTVDLMHPESINDLESWIHGVINNLKQRSVA